MQVSYSDKSSNVQTCKLALPDLLWNLTHLSLHPVSVSILSTSLSLSLGDPSRNLDMNAGIMVRMSGLSATEVTCRHDCYYSKSCHNITLKSCWYWNTFVFQQISSWRYNVSGQTLYIERLLICLYDLIALRWKMKENLTPSFVQY